MQLDKRALRLSRDWFIASQLVPCVLYYFGCAERTTKFPATISFTIRKGIPKWIQHLLWVAGWRVFFNALSQKSALLKAFCLQMMATGVVTTWICPIGHGKKSDAVHFLGAGLYILDHIVLMQVLRMKKLHQIGFYGCFLLLVTALFSRKAIEKRHGLPSEGDVENSELERLRSSKLSPAERREIWWYELAVMIFENGVFASFTTGITS